MLFPRHVMTRKRHVDCLWNEELCLKITECIVNVVVPIFSSIQTLKWDFGLSTVVTIDLKTKKLKFIASIINHCLLQSIR